MKRILTCIFALFMTATVAGSATVATFPSGEAYADDCNRVLFLGLRPWYYGWSVKVTDPMDKSKQKCVIAKPKSDSDEDLAKFVWSAVLNVSYDLSLLVGYVCLIFVIWGGFKYIMSTGEPPKVAEAKKQITNALIGLVIGVLATVIIYTILSVIQEAVVTS